MDFIEPCFGIGHNLSLICQMTSDHHQCVCMVQCCFKSSETIRLIRDGSSGRPPRLSQSSGALRPPPAPRTINTEVVRSQAVQSNLCSWQTCSLNSECGEQSHKERPQNQLSVENSNRLARQSIQYESQLHRAFCSHSFLALKTTGLSKHDA